MRLNTRVFCPGVNSGKGNLELLAFCLSTRLDKFLRASSDTICRFSRMELANSSVVVDLPTWGIPKIVSIGYIACHPSIKKNGVSGIVAKGRVVS